MPQRAAVMGICVGQPSPRWRPTVSLDGRWRLRLDEQSIGLAQGWAQRPIESTTSLTVPGAIQSLDELAPRFAPSGGLRNSFLGTAFMERTVELQPLPAGRRWWLKLGGVAPAAHIWLNGQYVAYHNRPAVAAGWDVTDLARAGENRVTIAVVEQDVGLMGGLRFGGHKWSGIHRDVELQQVAPQHAEHVYCWPSPADGRVTVSVEIHNDDAAPAEVTPSLEVTTPSGQALAASSLGPVVVPAGGSVAVELCCEIPPGQEWSPSTPRLHTATISLHRVGELVDRVTTRFGMRRLEAKGNKLLLNGSPVFLRGCGGEFFSPTIAPLTDRELIRRRWGALRAMGFDFYRCHTYAPTDEELDAADEVGLILCSEISVVSNFGRCEPFDAAMDVLRAHVMQTRSHASLGIYCLGNEGVQIMVKNASDREQARAGYAAIKELAPDRLAMIAFGMQGELPELPNDVESPHLWSDYFTWAYDGLSRTPWGLLPEPVRLKPCLVHEYGKFGLWPDAAEQKLYPPGGYAQPFGESGQAALAAAGIEGELDAVVRNSRLLQQLCWRTSMEQARRQPAVSGYIMWTGFRMGGRNSGFVDDMGHATDLPADVWSGGANAPVALLIDRDFDGRAVPAGSALPVAFWVSNVGPGRCRGGQLRWRLGGEGWHVEGRLECPAVAGGDVAAAGSASAFVPPLGQPQRLKLSAQLTGADGQAAANSWDFWAFPQPRPQCGLVVCDLADEEFGRRFRTRYPLAVRPMDVDSMLRGCREWSGMDLAADFAALPPDVVVADRLSEAASLQFARGGTVVLMDTGRFDAAWYPPPVTNDGPFDVNTSYTNFRSGWSQGNIATVIHPHAMLGGLPHDGWCDVHFYSMVQYARPVRTQGVATEGVEISERRVVIRSVPKLTPAAGAGAVVQDPNARNVQAQRRPVDIATEDRAYLLEATTLRGGRRGRLIICTLRLLDDPAGQYLLGELLSYAASAGKSGADE